MLPLPKVLREALHLPAASRLSLPFQLALLRQDGPQTLDLLEKIFQSIHRPAPFAASPLYCHLPEKEGAGKGQQMMLRMMVNGVEKTRRVHSSGTCPNMPFG